MKKPRTFWVVIGPAPESYIFIHSAAYHRSRCIERLLLSPDFGLGDVWAYWYRKGYRARKFTVKLERP